ncbi:chemotaxis protein CheD [Actimicrobium antarcticum]|uniref:Probable chemoreceptor glutamine deamidase CheD n=1 Tax=Actimicrobium antarcticum TaxID=1051899 RepID=A0ABP7SQ07_9BURK
MRAPSSPSSPSAVPFASLAAREIFLNPGELGSGCRNEVFGTLLGSCVAITLWHPVRRFGCLCHFILPTGATTALTRGRYGDTAFALMQAELVRNGVLLSECVAKLFGGGRMFVAGATTHDVGKRNIAMARDLLRQARLVPASEHVGGDGYRRLYFDITTGDVWLKFDWIDTDQHDVVL